MLWFIVIPSAAFISALTILAFSCIHVTWNAKEINYEGPLGKFSAKANEIVAKVDNNLNGTYNLLAQQQASVQNNYKKLETLSKSINAYPVSTAIPMSANYPHPQEKNLAVVNSNLSEAIMDLKNQSAQIAEKMKIVQSQKDELNKLKQELNKNTTH